MKNIAYFCLSFSYVFGSVNYDLIADPYFSPYAGASDLLLTEHGLENLGTYAFPSDAPSKETWRSRLARLTSLVLFWDPLGYALTTTQHEVFGHGYRIRSLGNSVARVSRYKIGVPPPYGPGGGATHLGYGDPHKLTIFEGIAIDTAGMEASSILATRIKMQWLQRGGLAPKQTSLYLSSQHDMTNYILWTSSNGQHKGDISEYVRLLNRLYPNDTLNVHALKKQAWINFLDPFTYYTLFSWWEYVFRGTDGPMPMIRLGSYRYLPGMRLGLTPFGPEYYFDNFFVKKQRPIHLYLRGGKHAGASYLGLGVEHTYLWNRKTYSAGIRMDTWLQPYTDFNNPCYSYATWDANFKLPSVPDHHQLGISGSFILRKKMWKQAGLYVEVGGKTAGFVQGESLQASAIARVGLTFWEG